MIKSLDKGLKIHLQKSGIKRILLASVAKKKAISLKNVCLKDQPYEKEITTITEKPAMLESILIATKRKKKFMLCQGIGQLLILLIGEQPDKLKVIEKGNRSPDVK